MRIANDYRMPANGNGVKSQFLKLSSGQTYRVRIIGHPVEYLQHWEPVICRAPAEGDPLAERGYTPKPRYSSWVIDRADGTLKVMDYPPTVYEKLVKWKNSFGAEPGGADGPDFEISLRAPSGNQKYTKYEIMNLDRSPLSDADREAIKKVAPDVKALTAKLAELRRDNTPGEISLMLENKGLVPRSQPLAASQAKAQPQQQKPLDSEANDLGF